MAITYGLNIFKHIPTTIVINPFKLQHLTQHSQHNQERNRIEQNRTDFNKCAIEHRFHSIKIVKLYQHPCQVFESTRRHDMIAMIRVMVVVW